MAYSFDPTELLRSPPRRVPGYCVFIDIVESTRLKDRPIHEWATWFHNTFVNAMCCLGWCNEPFKIIGDCCMFYLSEEELNAKKGHALSLFSGLCQLAAEPDDRIYRDVRVGVSFCLDAFEISFEKGTLDVYGRDIDLTHRLMGLAEPREVVMNEAFAKRVQEIYSRLQERDAYGDVQRIFGPWPQKIKGFDEPIPIYKAAAQRLPSGHWEPAR